VSFLFSTFTLAFGLVAAVTSSIQIPGGSASEPEFPAPPGYLLPWAGGEIHSVTQGEDTPFTHNGLAAYAIDFDLGYDTVVAARGGRVAMLYDGSNSGGCSAFYSSSTNYVVIDHGDGSAGLYMHLAYSAVEVEVGQMVRRGEAIAVSGETGVTCAGESGLDPGAHLHFQVQPFVEGKYMTQSQPIAFDDIPTNNGVAVSGQSYVSGNFAPGKPQKIKLTPYRVSRVFNPQAVPLFPDLVPEEEVPAIPPEDVPPTPEDSPTPTETPIPLVELTITPEPSPTDEPTSTWTPEPLETVVPTPEAPTAVPSETPTEPVVPTPLPPTETPTPEPPEPEPSP
jgi:murein DD-endopeptidase MepM/ murein hydrolase activator NlpD